MTNIIDIKKLPVREGKTSDTYLTLSQEGDLTRTTIVIPEGGNTDNVDLTDYYTKSEVDNLISNIEIPEGGTTGGVTEEWVEANYVNKERIGFIGNVKKYTTKAYYYDDNGVPVYIVYEDVTTNDIRNRNIEVYNKYIEGKIDVLFYKEYKNNETTTSYDAELGKDVTYETPKFAITPTFSQLSGDGVEFMYYQINTYNGETHTSTLAKRLTDKGTVGTLRFIDNTDIKMLTVNLYEGEPKLKANDFDLPYEKVLLLEIAGNNDSGGYNRKVILNYSFQTVGDWAKSYYKWWGFFNENTIISYEFTEQDKNNGIELTPTFTTISSGGAEGGNTDNVDLTDYYTKSEVDSLIQAPIVYYGSTLVGVDVYSAWQSNKPQFMNLSSVDDTGMIYEGFFPLNISMGNGLEEMKVFGWLDESTIVKWVLNYEDYEGYECVIKKLQ